LRKGSLFLKNKIRGIIERKNTVDKEASKRFKLSTFNAEEESVRSNLM
jgi:hypothetical protein